MLIRTAATIMARATRGCLAYILLLTMQSNLGFAQECQILPASSLMYLVMHSARIAKLRPPASSSNLTPSGKDMLDNLMAQAAGGYGLVDKT